MTNLWKIFLFLICHQKHVHRPLNGTASLTVNTYFFLSKILGMVISDFITDVLTRSLRGTPIEK